METKAKGRGVVAECMFRKGEFICEYSDELVSRVEGEKRKESYKEELGSYLFFFKHEGKDLWFVAWINVLSIIVVTTNSIDATEDNGSKGRLVNHSKKKPILRSK